MQLKRLEVHGFKTFANATSLDFSPGITAIVGPNGSGKSNVSDAIVWGLGEANVRALRGGKLQDVIFAGSSGRRPTGLAEVTLTFDNGSRALPLDYAEVSVTRRVYRSDESEYFINRTPCRLRDIVDLFLDTGIGRESYFALNQGEIDMVLSVNPEERRALFEEAAGVKKYRVRKRESLRKLEATRANLLRIHDLMGEVEARVTPLQRQAEAAKKYRELAVRLREAELGAFAAAWGVLGTRMRANLEELQGVRTAAAGVEAELARLAVDEEQARLTLHATGEQLESAHRHHESLTAESARLEGSIRVLEERIKADAAASERARLRASQIDAQRDEIQGAITTSQDELAVVEKSLRDSTAEMAELRQKLAAAEVQLKSCSIEADRAQSRAVERAGRLARLDADREASTRRLQTLHGQVKRLEDRLQQLQSERAALQAREADISRDEEDLEKQTRADRNNIESLHSSQRQAQSELAGALEDIRSRERNAAEQASRLRVLQELQEQREGFFKGVKSVLQAHSGGKLPGHYRAVADILAVKKEYEAAIEAALGGSVQDIVTRTDEEARAGIHFLKRTNAGRATFLSLDLVSRLSRPGQRPVARAPGVLGIAIELVHFDDLYAPVMEMLLGRIIVCDTLENGNAAAPRLSHWSRMVTLEGEVISSQGAMTGGSRQGARASIVGRSGQIEELKVSLQEIRKGLDEAAGLRSSLQAKVEAIRQQLASAERQAQAVTTAQAQHRRDREHLTRDSARLAQEEASLRKELERATGQERSEEELGLRLAAQAQEGSGQEETTAPIEDFRRAAAEAAAVRDSLREDLSRLGAAEAGLRERSRSLRGAIDSNSSRLQRLESERRGLQAQVESDHSAVDRLRVELEEAAEGLLRNQKALLESEEAVSRSRREREAAVTFLEALSEQTRRANRLQQEHVQTIYSLKSARVTIESEMQRIRNVLSEDYGVQPGVQLVDEQAEPVEASLGGVDEPEIPVPAGSDFDVDPVAEFLRPIPLSSNPERDQQQAARLRRQMRALEPVNLDAIEEAEAVAQRLEFLKGQRADIEAANRDLEEVIRKIDEEARERFMATFGAVAIHFDDLFRQLFGGGQTRLTLTDPSDPTGGGIEISAQPPGKKLQNLQLLSGGERSLTAVALLFAMLRVRPVPFCIMDEVDAALDEANIARFGEMVRTFAEKTQFIIITHNRGTMEVAGQLYGVTMTEPGVSRVLALKLEDVARTQSEVGNGHHPASAAVMAQ